MLGKVAPAFFIEQASQIEPARMFADGFGIGTGLFNYIFQGYSPIFAYYHQDLDAIVVRHTFQMAFHLPGGFYLFSDCALFRQHNFLFS
jgi:hypothetical protein